VRRLADLPLGWKLHGAFALVVLILLALSGMALETIAANQREAAAVERTERVIGQANAALSSLVDMETSFRGYLIAGQPDYLEPYTYGRTRFEVQMARLIRETADNPTQLARWREIEQGAMAWEAQTVEPAITQRRAAGPDAPIPPEVVTRMRSGEGKAQFDRIRVLFDQAIADEQATLAARTAEAAEANARLRTTLAVGSALGVLLAVALAAALSRDVVRAVGQLAAAAGRVAGGRLGERVGLRRGDEIGRAAAAVDRMADELQQLIYERDRVLASVGDGIVRLDAEGTVQFANAAAARLLGYGVDELIGQPFWEIAQRGSEGVFWRRDGTTFQVELTSAPMLDGDRVVGTVVDFRDVSEREQLRAEQVARTEAEVALRERNDVLATVSHDLKTPLTSVKGIS
jgi:CHASE3 domain sensor protein